MIRILTSLNTSNHPERATRIVAFILSSLLLQGCFLDKRSDATDPSETAIRPGSATAKTLANSPVLIDQSNLNRNSGPALYVRINALFPNLYPFPGEVENFKTTPKSDADPETAPLRSKDRFYSTLAQYSLRKYVLSGCKSPDALDFVFKADATILMSGETLPTDPFLRAAFAGARNVWLYPYETQSVEVATLAEAYREMAADATGKIDPAKQQEALQSLCSILLSSPQFWLGNPNPNDVVRRTVLEIGHRVPTFKDYEDYIQKKKSIQDIVRNLQSTDSYINIVKEWHKTWLGFFPVGAEIGFESRPYETQQAGVFGAVMALVLKFDRTANPADASLEGSDFAYLPGGYQFSALDSIPTCQHKVQTFDPRTSQILWEQKNPVNGLWELIGGWKRNKSGATWLSTWSKLPGKVTLANGVSTIATSVDDIQFSYSRDRLADAPATNNPQEEVMEYVGEYQIERTDPNAPDLSGPGDSPGYHYTGKLRNTPLKRFLKTDRRVRRFGMDGLEQNGMSKVYTSLAGAPIYVCNGVDRYLASCLYRPNLRNQDNIIFPRYIWSRWKASEPIVNADGYNLRDTIMHPTVLDSMACGVPDGASIARLGTAAQFPNPWDDPNESKAFPRGYSDYATPASQLALNTRGTQLSLTTFSAYDYLPNYSGFEDMDYPEIQAIYAYQRDMNDEPYRLVDDLIRNRKPYSGLVTAPYTFGGEAYESVLRGQGYFLPVDPPGFVPTRTPAAILSPRQINYTDFATIPLKYLESVWGSHHIEDDTYFKDLTAIGEIRPKAHSGILNMPSFLGAGTPAGSQDALGMRTMSARYFERLLCQPPSSIVLTASQAAMHTTYIPLTEGAAKDHLDPQKGCYSCHVNLDPLAAALSPAFSLPGGITAPAVGDLRIMPNAPYYQGSFYGIRGGGTPGKGALLGTEVTRGIKQVGEILASSKEFYRCVATRAFENIYGRAPAFSDAKEFSGAVLRFKEKQIYNDLILDLVSSSSTYEKGN